MSKFEESRCVCMRNGIEIWLPLSKAKRLLGMIADGKKHIVIGKRMINTADVVGVFTPSDILEKIDN